MIETTIPEINVVELMERVRAKAEEIRRLQARPKLPPIAEVHPPPQTVLPTAVVPKTKQILEATNDARRAVRVSRWVPKPLRVLFRRHDHFDRDVLRAIESLAQTNAQLAERFRHLAACVEVQDHTIRHFADVRRNDSGWMRAAAEIITTADERATEFRAAMQAEVDAKVAVPLERLGTLQSQLSDLQSLATKNDDVRLIAFACRDRLDQTADQFATLRADLGRAGEHLRNLQHQFESLSGHRNGLRNDFERASEHLRHLQDEVDVLKDMATGFRGDLDRAGEHLRNLQQHLDHVTAERRPLQSGLDVLTGEFRIIRDEFNRAGEHLRNLQSEVDRAATQSGDRTRLEQAVAELEQRLTNDGSYLKGELSQQRSILGQLLASNGAKQRPPNRGKQTGPAPIPDAFYVSFEDRFRGSRKEIKHRQEYYLPVILASKAGDAQRPVLDLGCGRGEWLELLADHKLESRGVDLNSTMVAHCHERRLDVAEADVVAYLRKLKAASLGAVTGFHIIEHLRLDTLLELLAQTYRALKPGGVAIFESPNCKNLVVGASNFNIDPTHQNPIYPETAEFMLSLQGFTKVELHYLAPVADSPFRDNSPGSKFLDERLFGPQDFAVIGHKLLRR